MTTCFFPRFPKVMPCEYSVCLATSFYYSMSGETSDSDVENDTSGDLYERGESGCNAKRRPAKPSRKLPKEYDTSDSDDQVEIVVKKRCRKRPKMKDSTDKGSDSSDYETAFDERGLTSDSDLDETLIQHCFREYNCLNQQSSYEHFDEYRIDDDEVFMNDVQSIVTAEGKLMNACVLSLHSDIFNFQLQKFTAIALTKCRKTFLLSCRLY